jgi:hypothetical protein
MGYSESAGLSSGFNDVFIVSCTKASAAINWIRYIGTSSFDEFSMRMAVSADGTIYGLSRI